MPKKNALTSYRLRRNTKASGEPAARVKKRKSKKRIFVIQKHKATRLHYDLRLEIDGVLASWAVPKGPSLNPKERRLAVRTDNHPMAYAQFEGAIESGHYGAGTVMVWDTGTYTNIKKENGRLASMKKCLKQGRIEVFIQGERIVGNYALVRMRDDQWLLVKMKDEYAHARKSPVSRYTKSVVTDRTMRQIAKDASE